MKKENQQLFGLAILCFMMIGAGLSYFVDNTNGIIFFIGMSIITLLSSNKR